MKMTKILSIILAISMIVVGCSSKDDKNVSEENFKSAINSDYINLTMVKPKTINPILNKEKSVGYIMNLVYDSLFTIDENYNTVPQLVKEYSISNDGKYIDIKLNDATWHDNLPVTSSDVAFTVDLIKDSKDSPYKELVENINSISLLEEKEFRINFKTNYPFSIETLVFPILPKHKLSGLPEKEIMESNKNLIGAGQYKIVKYEDRDGMILQKNEDYYKELPSTTKNIKVNIVPDYKAQVSMVMALDSDIANISLNDLSKFYNEKEFRINHYEGREYESLIFNYNNPLLRDVNFRRAIASSIDKKRILEEAYMSDAQLVDFPLNLNSKYYNKDIKTIVYSEENAKKYLDKVFNKDNKSNTKSNKTEINNNKQDDVEDTVLTKNIIKNANLKIVVNKSNTERLKTAHIISENLKSIGIKSTIEKLENEELDRAIDSKNYDIALVGWELPLVPDATNIIKSLDYNDEKLNSYIDSLLKSTNQDNFKQIYKSIQKYVNENVVMISLVIRDDYMVTNKRIEGKILSNDFDVYEGIVNLKIKNN